MINAKPIQSQSRLRSRGRVSRVEMVVRVVRAVRVVKGRKGSFYDLMASGWLRQHTQGSINRKVALVNPYRVALLNPYIIRVY